MGGFRIFAVVVVAAFLLSGCAPDKTNCNHDNYTGGECATGGSPASVQDHLNPNGPGDPDWDLLDSATGLRLDDLAEDSLAATSRHSRKGGNPGNSKKDSHPELDSGPSLYSEFIKEDSGSGPGMTAVLNTFTKLSAQGALSGFTTDRPDPSDATGIFVDAVLGDNANPGTMAAPVATLQAGVNKARNQGKVVFVAGGAGRTYGPFWADGAIYCGYNHLDWSRDRETYPSAITGGADKRWGVAVGSARAALIDGCNISGGDASWEATLGTVVWGSAILRANRIDGGAGYSRAHGVGLGKTCVGSLEMYSNIVDVRSTATLAAGGVVIGGCDAKLINNTVVVRSSATYGRAFTSWAPALSSLLVNNIFDSSGAASNRAVNVIGGSSVRLVNNLLSVPGGWPDATVFGWTALNDWQRVTDEAEVNNCSGWSGYCDESSSNVRAANPGYTDEARGDYRLLESSPGVNAGIDPASYVTDDYSHEDVSANYRPAGSGWDIGAHELTIIKILSGIDDSSPYSYITCTLDSNGNLKCWGDYAYGMEGIVGAKHSFPKLEAPSNRVSGFDSPLKDFAIVATHELTYGGGQGAVCGLEESGKVKCWGDAVAAGLGSGADVTIPQTPAGLQSNVISIIAGLTCTCALLNNGSVKCWGENGAGECGSGTSGVDIPEPAIVNGLGGNAVYITSGLSHKCALIDNGSIKCWGNNASGQLGIGDIVGGPTPQSVMLPDGLTAKSIRALEEATCAKLTDDNVYCWGDMHSLYTLFDNPSENIYYPQKTSKATQLPQIYGTLAPREYRQIRILDDGSLEVWGSNYFGSLGTQASGITYDSPSYPNIDGVTKPVKQVALVNYTSCFLYHDGQVDCIGSDEHGMLGNGDEENPYPEAITGFGQAVIDIDSYNLQTCAILANGNVKCWGDEMGGVLYSVENQALPITDVSVGVDEICGIDNSGRALCWNKPQRFSPAYATEIIGSNVSSISAGGHKCAVENGGLKCWSSDPPLDFISGFESNVSKINAGPLSTLAVMDSGDLIIWGYQVWYEYCSYPWNGDWHDVTCEDYLIQPGIDPTIIQKTDSTDLYKIDAIDNYDYLILKSTGDMFKINGNSFVDGIYQHNCVYYYYDPYYYCYNYGSPAVSPHVPFSSPMPKVIDWSASSNHSCYLFEDSTVICKGDNSSGQLGNGTFSDNPSEDFRVPLSGPAVKIDVRDKYSCALLDDGSVECWGLLEATRNSYYKKKRTYLPVTVINLLE